jgi:hypothetical protein
MLPTIDRDYIIAGINFIAVLLILREINVRLWLRLLILFFIPIGMSVFAYILIKWSGVRLTVLEHVPGLRYSSLAMAFGYGLGRMLNPSMIIYFSYWLIRLLRSGKLKTRSTDTGQG